MYRFSSNKFSICDSKFSTKYSKMAYSKFESYIAFFDIMGFKKIVENNDLEELIEKFNNLLRDSQLAVSGNKITAVNGGYIPDFTYQKINCLHVSDSVIFWTNRTDEEDFNEIAKVCLDFQYKCMHHSLFAIRGALTFGEIAFDPTSIPFEEYTFRAYSIIGKGLIDSYVLGESIEMAACLFDKSALEKAGTAAISKLIDEGRICNYQVPFKNGIRTEMVVKPQPGANFESEIQLLFTRRTKENIESMDKNVSNKMTNTIEFYRHFK